MSDEYPWRIRACVWCLDALPMLLIVIALSLMFIVFLDLAFFHSILGPGHWNKDGIYVPGAGVKK